MNSFIAGKLGEVLAFARIGKDTAERGEQALLKLMSQEDLDKVTEGFDDLENALLTFSDEQQVTNDVEDGARETEEKVTSMRDTYIDGNWDEESEILEWMGFYTGAALVHWHLIEGAAIELELEDLVEISRSAIEYYQTMFVLDEEALKEIGAAHATR